MIGEQFVEKMVAESIVEVFQEQGVDTVFGLPGGLVSPLYAALTKTNLRVVTCKQESNAVLTAAGYSLATGKPSVAAVTAGPGVTNAIAGVATAMTERIPVVLFGGEVPRSAFGRGALQEGSSYTFDAVGMMSNIAKFSSQLVRADSAAATVRRAFATAQSGVPGPAFLSLPVDVGAAMGRVPSVHGTVSVAVKPDAAACHQAFELLNTAERPLIIAGSGARGRAGRRALVRLAEASNAPVAVTPKGKGVFPEDHPLYIGVFGFGGHESVIDYLKMKPDVVIVCGAGLNDFSTNAWSPLLQPSKGLIHIDLDATKFGLNYSADICLLGRLEEVIPCMLESPSSSPRTRQQVRFVRQSIAKTYGQKINTFDVMMALNKLAPRNAIYTVDMGEHLAFALHYLSIEDGQEFVTCLGFGAMGSSIPVGIGLALGAKKAGRRVYIICGDGGFNLAGLEINTAVMWGAPVTFVLLNDSRLNMCHFGMLDRYGATNDFTTPSIDFATVAKAAGARGAVINTVEELNSALKTSVDGPVVLDIRIDPDVRLGGSQRTAALRQFSEKT